MHGPDRHQHRSARRHLVESLSPSHDATRRGGLAHRIMLTLACVLALALALETGCTIRARGQYDVGVGKASRLRSM